MSDVSTAPYTILEIIGVVTAILVLVMLVLQLLDRRDSKKSHDITEPMNKLQTFIRSEFHKGELLMQEMAHDIAENKRDVTRVEKEQERLRTVERTRKSTEAYRRSDSKAGDQSA